LVPTFNRHVPLAVHHFERLALLFTLCSALVSEGGQCPPCALKSNICAANSTGSAEKFVTWAGIPTVPAEELLAPMLNKVDDLCAERDRLVGEGRRKYPGTRLITNTRGNPLYYLIWAGPHPKGLDGANHILGKSKTPKPRRGS